MVFREEQHVKRLYQNTYEAIDEQDIHLNSNVCAL
jgi:hypothetical protein